MRVLEREDESYKGMEVVQASFPNLMEENKELNKSIVASIQELNMKYDSVEAENKNMTLKRQKPVMELQQSIQKLEQERKQQYEGLSHKLKIVNGEIQALKEESQKLKLDFQKHMNSSGWLLEF